MFQLCVDVLLVSVVLWHLRWVGASHPCSFSQRTFDLQEPLERGCVRVQVVESPPAKAEQTTTQESYDLDLFNIWASQSSQEIFTFQMFSSETLMSYPQRIHCALEINAYELTPRCRSCSSWGLDKN